LGPLGGILTGLFVGISGALWEPILIPLLGNMALGISTGLPTYYRFKIQRAFWIFVCILSSVFIGGFLPTFSIEILVFGVPLVAAMLTASLDALQAGIWIFVAIFFAEGVVDPILHRYKTPSKVLE
jgi:hypothetical protein